jgi:hypothetical protein
VLSETSGRVTDIHFLVWCEFAAPEINALEYLMAVGEGEGSEGFHTTESSKDCDLNSCPQRQRFRAIVRRFYPKNRCTPIIKNRYDNPPLGYNIPWNYITRKEQEYAEVYMLGRLLWCIFEGMSAPQRGAIWCSYHHEPEYDFPEFHRTPPELRALIEQCTRGRRRQLSSLVVRKGNKIVFRDDMRGDGTPGQIKAVAKKFWEDEVLWAEDFVMKREKTVKEGTLNTNHFGRPTLSKVHQTLEAFQAAL